MQRFAPFLRSFLIKTKFSFVPLQVKRSKLSILIKNVQRKCQNFALELTKMSISLPQTVLIKRDTKNIKIVTLCEPLDVMTDRCLTESIFILCS